MALKMLHGVRELLSLFTWSLVLQLVEGILCPWRERSTRQALATSRNLAETHRRFCTLTPHALPKFLG